jgi:hypothetical protein
MPIIEVLRDMSIQRGQRCVDKSAATVQLQRCMAAWRDDCFNDIVLLSQCLSDLRENISISGGSTYFGPVETRARRAP